MGDPRLSVVMVNYNTIELAVASLRSLRSAVGSTAIEVIVVDNASAAFDGQVIREAWPEADIVVSPENLGFGRGNNLGAARARGEYLWLLNTDTLCLEGHGPWPLVDFLDGHADYAAVSPLLIDGDGVVQPWQTAWFPSLWRMVLAPPARQLGRRFPALRPRLGRIDTNLLPRVAADIDQVVAAAVVVRRAAFEEVGGFSPEYFFFLEDTDLCRKLHVAGWRIRWLPDVRMVHLWGRSVTDPVARQRMFFAAQDLYVRRWHRAPTAVALRVLRLPLRASAHRTRRRLRREAAGAPGPARR